MVQTYRVQNPEIKGAVYEVEEHVQTRILELNAADVEIYAAARVRFDALCHEHGVS